MILAVCDDCAADRSKIEELLRQYLNNNDITAKIYTFSSGEEFLEFNERPFDVVFMDIFMTGLDGLVTAKQYFSPSCRFVFTTVTPEFSFHAFSVNVAHYLIKPVSYSDIEVCMKRCFPAPQKNDFIYVKQKKLTMPISQSEIIFIEVLNNNVIINTVSDIIDVRMTLTGIYDILDHNIFIRPHRSFVVNMNYIENITLNSLTLTNGHTISIAREHKSTITAAYERFLFNKVRNRRLP